MTRLKSRYDLKIPPTLLRFSSTENFLHHRITAVYGTKIIDFRHWNDDSCGNSIGLEKLCVIVSVRAQKRVCNFVANARRIERARLPFSIFFFFFFFRNLKSCLVDNASQETTI